MGDEHGRDRRAFRSGGLAFGLNNTLYVSSFLNDRILTYNRSTGDYTGIYRGSTSDPGLISPTYLTYVAADEVPEPGTVGLVAPGLSIAALVRRRART